MTWNEAILKDWSNPKEITVKEIAYCIKDAPEQYLNQIINKNKCLNDTRQNSIGKEFVKIANKMAKTVVLENVLIDTAKALGSWFTELGGCLYDGDGLIILLDEVSVDTIISGGNMPTHIKTVDEAIAVSVAISLAMSQFTLLSCMGTRKHNNAQNAKTTNNPFLKMIATKESQQKEVLELLKSHLMSNGFTNKDRAYRIASKITKLITSI